MIQVIERAAAALEFVAAKETATLAELSQEMGLKKTTLNTILMTLSSVGLLEKVAQGHYALGPKITSLGKSIQQAATLRAVAESVVERLARATGEHTVASVLRGGTLRYLATAHLSDKLSVTGERMAPEPVIETATGRILAAHLEEDAALRLTGESGFPLSSWPEATNKAVYLDLLAGIRAEGMVFRADSGTGTVALAVPVMTKEGIAFAAVGVALPTVRFDSTRKAKLICEMRHFAAQMATELNLEF